MNLIVVALVLSAAINVWLAVTRRAARSEVLDQDDQLYRTSRAAAHLVNGTVSGDPDVVDEMAEIRFCAYCEAAGADRPLHTLTEGEQTAIRVAARRRLVAEGHMTLDHAHRANQYELASADADVERTETEAVLARAAS